MEVRQLAVAVSSLLRACAAVAAAAAAAAGPLCSTAGRIRTPRLGTHGHTGPWMVRIVRFKDYNNAGL